MGLLVYMYMYMVYILLYIRQSQFYHTKVLI